MLTVGPVTFHLYGLLIGLGILAAAGVAERVRLRLAKSQKSYQKFIVWDSLLWIVGLGIIGARTYHVIDYFDYYWLHPGKILFLWEGGMGIFGGIAGGLLGAWITTQSKKRFLKLIDLLAVGAPLGQAIGRWGNYFNHELYGLPTKLPWGIFIPVENRLIQFIDIDRYHPVFAYEMIWNLLVFALLYYLVVNRRIKSGTGVVFTSYLGLYGLGRFFLEFLKINPWHLWGINVAQAISVLAIVFALINFKTGLTGKR